MIRCLRGRAHRWVGLVVLIGVLVAALVGALPRPAFAEPVEPAEPAAAVRLPTEAVWPVASAQVVRGFDPPAAPWDAAHRGVDLAASVGTPVRAAAAGVVSHAAELAGRGVVVVQHGAVRTTYEPVTATVAVGDRVGAGARIGTVQADRRSPPHCPESCLHWGLRHVDVYLDPLLLVADRPAGGEVRLLAEADAAAAAQRARERAAEQSSVGVFGSGVVGIGPGGEHGFVLPAQGPVTSRFGMRRHPVLGMWKLHDGADIGAPCGAPLRAPADGTVVSVGYDGGYGHRLLIDHGEVAGHRVLTALAHATGYHVSVGDRVRRGEVVGAVGSTGYSTGCHLHLMVWLDGALVDPLTWF